MVKGEWLLMLDASYHVMLEGAPTIWAEDILIIFEASDPGCSGQ